MKTALKISFLGLLFVFSAAATARAEYFPPPFFVLAGRADLIVVGTIVEVSPETFTLKVEEVLAGSVRAREIEVLRFKDWMCSTRWKPYEAGQREVAFLDQLDRSEAGKTGARYGTMSDGDEGEWEIIGNEVSVQGFRIPGGREFNEGEHPGQWLPLDLVLDAIRRFRRCLSVTAGESVWDSQARLTCSARELAAYRSTSRVHEYLVSTALGDGRPR